MTSHKKILELEKSIQKLIRQGKTTPKLGSPFIKQLHKLKLEEIVPESTIVTQVEKLGIDSHNKLIAGELIRNLIAPTVRNIHSTGNTFKLLDPNLTLLYLFDTENQIGISENIVYVTYGWIQYYKSNLKNIDPFQRYPKKLTNLFDYVRQVDIDIPTQMIETEFETFENGMTPIELAIELSVKYANNELVRDNLIIIINKLKEFPYKRPPSLLAKYLNVSIEFPNYWIDIEITKLSNDPITDINTLILERIMKMNILVSYREIGDFINIIGNRYDKYHVLDTIVELKNHTNLKLLNLSTKDILYHIYSVGDLMLFKKMGLKYGEIKVIDHFDLLERAVKSQKCDSVIFILKCIKNIASQQYSNKDTILHKLLIDKTQFNPDVALIIKTFCHYDPKIIDVRGNHGKTLLHLSAYSVEIMNLLLSLNPNTNLEDELGNTFIYDIIETQNENIIRNALYHAIDINHQNKNKITPIMFACPNEQIVKLLLEHEPDLSLSDNLGNTFYHYVCHHNILLGSKVVLTKNMFGKYPTDYTELGSKYYQTCS